MNEIMNESAGKVIKLYKGLTYSDEYGTSIVITIIFVITLFLVYAYFKTKMNSQPIKDNWAKVALHRVNGYASRIPNIFS